MRRYKKLILFILPLLFTHVGCGPSLLKNWVKERGYTYYPDYSTLKILGYEVRDSQLRSNPFLSLVGEKGDIPDITQKKKRVFKIEGSTEIEHFLKTITEGNITGKFEVSAEAEMTLEKPFKETASAFIPVTPCVNREMLIVTDVLNTGIMKVTIKDKKGVNITASFKPKQAGEIKGNVQIEFGNEITISGKGFYVGYFAELKRCVKVKEKEILINKDNPFYRDDDGIGIYANLYGYRKNDGLGEALVYIGPSNYFPGSGLSKEEFEVERKMWAQVGRTGVFMECLSDPWLSSVDPPKGDNTDLWRGTTIKGYRLKFGTHLGIAGIPNVTGIYLEVLSVSEQEVKLKAQCIRYEDVKKKKE